MIGGQPSGERKAASFRHNNVFHKSAFGLSRTTEKTELPASVMSASKTLIAFPAWHCRIYSDLITGFNSFYRFANFNNNACSLMSYGEGIFYFLSTYLSLCIIMNI